VRIKANPISPILSSPQPICLPESFWDVARECRDQATSIINFGYVQESVRLFGLGMRLANKVFFFSYLHLYNNNNSRSLYGVYYYTRYVDILKAVEVAAESNKTLGRFNT
jgi:hypothetical protein